MSSRDPWFVRWSHTTHPDALMHLVSGNRDCCRQNEVGAMASSLAHSFADSCRKGHL